MHSYSLQIYQLPFDPYAVKILLYNILLGLYFVRHLSHNINFDINLCIWDDNVSRGCQHTINAKM